MIENKDSSDDDAKFVDAKAAAKALGVSVPTLYAYVGRKRIRTQRMPGTKKRGYWWRDIERVRGKQNRAGATPIPDGVTHETEITLMTQSGPYYRGRSALELAQTHSLEAVAGLLWGINEPEIFEPRSLTVPKEFLTLQKSLKHASTVDRATALFPFIEHMSPRSFDLTRRGMARTGAELLRWYTCILANLDRPDEAPAHETLAKALRLSTELADLVRSILVLSADHGFEVGTYAVRACATAGVTPYRSILAGLAVITGRRSNSGRGEAVLRLIEEIKTETDPKSPIVRRLKEGEQLPGFGSSFYENGDPRAAFLMNRYEDVFGDEKEFGKIRRALATAQELCGLHPNFVFANTYFLSRIGLDPTRSLFPLGRAVGWIAHSIEQFQAGEAMRWPERYTGQLPRKPLTQPLSEG
jgi:citrate synthase